jgi:hypothetical protein
MLRPMMISATMALLVAPFCVAQDAPKAEATFADQHKGKVPDADYEAKVGDRPVVLSLDKEDKPYVSWATFDRPDFRAYKKALGIKDRDEMKEMREAGKVARVEPYTPVLVSGIEEVASGIDDETSTMATVRVLEGPLKGKKLCIPAYSIARMIDPPAAKPKKKAVSK